MIRRNHQTGEVSLDPLRWGLIPYWCEDPKGGRKPINAKCETVRAADLPRRLSPAALHCPVDGFFEWKAIKGQKAKQPYAIAMKDGSPLALAGFGRTGKTRPRASGFAPLRSSQRTLTKWWPRSTTACRSSSRPVTMSAG